MSVTININNLSLCHKGSNGISTATVPDVCKTPSPGGPVPMPYPNISMSSDLADGSTTVTADGGNMIAIKGSSFSRSTGDEPGTLGGVKSSVNMKASKWILYSFDVKIDGENACRLTDKKTQNNENAIDAAGNMQPALAKAICSELTEELTIATEMLPASKSEGAVVAVGKYVPAGGGPTGLLMGTSSVSMTQASNAILRGTKYRSFAPGLPPSPTSNSQAKNCDGEVFQYKQTAHMPHTGHAESKILETLFAGVANQQPTGLLVIKIGGAWNKPCDNCQELIDFVNKKSDGTPCEKFQVEICI